VKRVVFPRPPLFTATEQIPITNKPEMAEPYGWTGIERLDAMTRPME
jgi:hypothetical protein